MNYHDFLYALATVAAGAGLTALRAYLQTVRVPQRLATITEMARQAVQAAEETGGASAVKYATAEQALVQLAKRVGLRLKPAEVHSFIQTAVKEMRHIEEAIAAQQTEAAA